MLIQFQFKRKESQQQSKLTK